MKIISFRQITVTSIRLCADEVFLLSALLKEEEAYD